MADAAAAAARAREETAAAAEACGGRRCGCGAVRGAVAAVAGALALCTNKSLRALDRSRIGRNDWCAAQLAAALRQNEMLKALQNCVSIVNYSVGELKSSSCPRSRHFNLGQLLHGKPNGNNAPLPPPHTASGVHSLGCVRVLMNTRSIHSL